MAATTIKIVLRKRENKDGTRPLVLRIIKDRKSSILHTGISLKTSEWDSANQKVKKSHPNSSRINNLLLKKLSEANEKSLALESSSKIISSKIVKENIKPNVSNTFFSQAESYLDNLKASGKFNQYSSDKPRVNHFKKFLKGADISFNDVTVGLLERYVTHLRQSGGKEQRTIMNCLAVIRSVFGYATRNKLIDKSLSPFGKEGIQIKFPESIKIGLTIEEVKRIEDVELPEGSYQNHARNLWLVAFYFAGMRVSDLLRLKWSDLQNDRLYYSMGKNNKSGSLKIPDKALKIIKAYEKEKKAIDDYIFPDLKKLTDRNDKYALYRSIILAIRKIDEHLRAYVALAAGIEKKLTMHIARHTFGNISGDKIPIQMLQKLYRHSSVTTTISYQSNFIFKDTDEALDSVIGF